MKSLKTLFLVLAAVAGLSTNTAWASHGGSHFVARHGFAYHGRGHRPGGWGPGFYGPWPWYYPWGYFGYSIPVFPATLYVEPAEPVQYIEMNPPANNANPPANLQPNVWYYCSNPQGYYPYVSSCSTNWQSVPAQPLKQ